MALKGKGNKVEVPAEDTTTTETAPVETKEVVTTESAPPPATGSVSMCIQNQALVEAVMDDFDMPLIFAKDGTHYMAGNPPVEFGREFTYFPILVDSYWVMDPGHELSAEAYEEFKKFADDGDNVPHDAKNRTIKEGITDRDGVTLGETMKAAIKAGHSKASIKRYVTIKCVIHSHEGKIDLEPYYDMVTLRIAPGSQWGPKGYETMIKGLGKAVALGRLKGTQFQDESVVLFKVVAENTSYKGGSSYTMSAIKPA